MSNSQAKAASGAWHWQRPGPAEQLIWQEQPVPTAPAGHVVVKNRAIGLNPVDWKFIEWGPAIWTSGQVPGVDGAGEVIEVGTGVSPDWLGHRVAYHQWLEQPGSFATHVVLPTRALMRVPPGLSWERAASLPCPLLTAWQAFSKVPAPDQGAEYVALVSGAGGAVGTLLVQLLARDWRVVAMCDERHWARLRPLGARECIPYSLDASPDAQRFDAVFDTVSGAHAASLAARVVANGHLVCVQDRVEKSPVQAFTTSVSLHEVALNAMHRYASDAQWRALVAAGERLMRDVLDGALASVSIQSGSMDALPDLLSALRDHRLPHRPVVRVE